MNNFIYQGGSDISVDDFKNHLTSLCQLENIGVLLGAGASVGCGGMTMQEVWEDFKINNEHLIPELKEFKLISDIEDKANNVNVEFLLDKVTQFLSVYKTLDTDKEGKETIRLSNILLALYQSVTKAALFVVVR